jgi:uncharacterized protein (TIGR02680 family)
MNEPITVLPSHDRWRPARAGLVGLWRYWDETFVFHHGRLLLRGPNGSGKSMALELLLPFLLDADASPYKLTSAAKPRGRLFDRIMAGSSEPSRVGFAWVEFAHGDDVFTVGARMRASHATAKADVDYFTTTLSVGRTLRLLDDNRSPLSRKALVEAIGDTGRVHDSPDEHRSAVREVLFPGFSADRYDSVIGALLALRREKVSQNLDLVKLSEVLSDALAPLDDHDIAAVAEGFERLDRRKAELLALEHDLAEVRQLTRQQRDYARAVIAGTAADVRTAETGRDDVTRTERQARDALDLATQRATAVADERRAIQDRDEAIKVEVEALKDSEAYRQGAGLADLRTQAHRLRDLALRAARTTEERVRERDVAVQERHEAADGRASAEANLELAGRDFRAAADAVGAVAVGEEAESVEEPDEGERLVHAWVRAQRGLIRDVRAALDAHDRAVSQRRFLDEQFASDEAIVDDRSRAYDTAVAAAAAAALAYAGSVESWADRCENLGPARLGAALPRPPDDPSLVAAAVTSVVTEVRAEEAVARQTLESERRAALDEQTVLLSERARWERGELFDPDGPPWRTDRAGRRGAPLWQLVDIRAEVPEPEIDRIEAALTGSGVLDAWVHPDGRVDLDPDRVDLVLTARPTGGRTLASWLTPAVEAAEGYGVPSDVVAAVLASIPVAASALDDGDRPEVLVATDGTYRLGSAVGRGPVRPAMLLGALARERHRLARLAELDAVLAVIDSNLVDLERRKAALDRLRAAMDAELGELPSGGAVKEAEQDVAASAARLAEARDRLETTRESRRAAEDAVRAALRELTALAARHGLPADREALAEIELALNQLWESTGTWARRRREVRAAKRQEERAAQRAAAAVDAAARAATDQTAAEQEARDIERRVATLESSIGVEYAEIVRRISELDLERKTNSGRAATLYDESTTLERRVGEFGARVEAAVAARAEAESHRDRSHQRMATSVEAFAIDAGLDIPGPLDTGTGLLAAARSIAVTHEKIDADPQTIRRLSERVGERVHAAQAALGASVDIERVLVEEGWFVLRTTAAGIRRRVTDLASALTAELAEGRAELEEQEERLFEQTLAGSVRRALADRIRQANALVDGINDQLAAVRSAAGAVQVRLRWAVDPEQPDAVKAARSLLLHDPADLSDGERSSLQDFVRARVDQARAELEANAPWEARLRETLDYRVWHRFSLQLAHRDWEGFVPATARRLQKLSTGERSIALHLPMIASVAAHYANEKGEPSRCPRLILLDELFAGVDTANRTQLFGTFTTWDLDAVFTSDHEWCQYETLDGIAIHHLHPPAGDEPVTSTRFTWDGRRRRIDSPAA